MTDEKINMEPVDAAPGATEPPVQPPSDNTTDPSAIDEDSLKAILEPLVQAEVEKIRQSVKDKRFSKHEGRIDSIEDTLAQIKELKDQGLSEKFAIEFLQMKETLGIQGQVEPTDAPPATEPAVPATVAEDDSLSAILNLTGLTSNEPEVVEILRERDPLKRVVALTSLAEARKQAQTTPAAAGNVLPSGTGATVSEETLETIKEQLDAELAKPKKDFQKVKELTKKHGDLLPKE